MTAQSFWRPTDALTSSAAVAVAPSVPCPTRMIMVRLATTFAWILGAKLPGRSSGTYSGVPCIWKAESSDIRRPCRDGHSASVWVGSTALSDGIPVGAGDSDETKRDVRTRADDIR